MKQPRFIGIITSLLLFIATTTLIQDVTRAHRQLNNNNNNINNEFNLRMKNHTIFPEVTHILEDANFNSAALRKRNLQVVNENDENTNSISAAALREKYLEAIIDEDNYQEQNNDNSNHNDSNLQQSSSSTASHNYKLTEQALNWCEPKGFLPLPYEECNHDGTFNEINFMAGLTNGLKMLLLDVISSFEQNRCFYVTEYHNNLMIRDDKSQELSTFLGRYFEPIGLDINHPSVQKARKEGRIYKTNWQENWHDFRKRRTHGYKHTIPSLGYEKMESTQLKKIMLQRMWQLLPNIRDSVCKRLETYGLDQSYLSFSVRRGDKVTEGFQFPSAMKYIEAAENARQKHKFESSKVFVATDDCNVMGEFRSLRPDWTFVSECDGDDQNNHHNGFVLTDMKQWTLEQTDEHFHKFFVELFGLVGSWFYIGVSYTNVAWWAFYMRPFKWAHQYVDTGSTTEHMLHIVHFW